MFKAVVMQVDEKSVMICDLYSLREFCVETNIASAFSLGDKVYVQYTWPSGKGAFSDQPTTDIFKVDRW